jgi:hypothetical protein
VPSNNLPVPSSGGLFPDRYERKLAKATSREVALIEAKQDLAVCQIEAIETVGHVALSSVAAVSALELAYAERDPHAAARLRFTTDQATLAITNRIARFERKLR